MISRKTNRQRNGANRAQRFSSRSGFAISALAAVLAAFLAPATATGQETCTIQALDLAYESPVMIASGVLVGDCPREVILRQSLWEEPFFEEGFEVAEDGRFIVEMPAPPEPGEEPLPISLDARSYDAEARLEAFFTRDPTGMPAVEPVPSEPPEPPEGLTGTWALTVRDVRSGHVNAPSIARLEQDGDSLTFFDACREGSILAYGRLEGERIVLLDPETESVIAHGEVSPWHILASRSEELPVIEWSDGESVFTHIVAEPVVIDSDTGPITITITEISPPEEEEEEERLAVLGAARIQDVGCEAAAPISYVTPFPMHMTEEIVQNFSLNPWSGFRFREPPPSLSHHTLAMLKYRNGMNHLTAAGKRWFDLPKNPGERSTGSKTTECSKTSAGGFAPMTCPSLGSGSVGYMECTTEGLDKSGVMQLSNRVALVSDPNVYPGALLQGAYLTGGAFTPITIPRSGGTLTLTGVDLSSPNIVINAKVPEITLANVSTARHNMIKLVPKTTGVFSWSSQEVYSFEHLMLKMHAHVKWSGGSLKANLSFSNTTKENFVLVKFTQRMYDLVFQPPAQPSSVFKEGKNFHDPWSQIGLGNRPVYVNKVSYGRQLFLVVQSKHTHQDIKASLKASISGQSASGSVDHKKVLDESKFTYVAFGGGVESAAAPLKQLSTSSSPGAAFKAVANAAADVKALAAVGTAEPIAFSLHDLIEHRPVQLGYSVARNERSCRVVSPGSQTYTYELKIDKVDDDIKVWVDQMIDKQEALHVEHIDANHLDWGWIRGPQTYPLNPMINRLKSGNSGDAKLIIRHGNGGGRAVYANMKLLLNGQTQWRYDRPEFGWSHWGWHSWAEIWVNPQTGLVNVTKDRR